MRPIRDLTDDHAEHALAASGWFARVGYPPHFPMTDAQALELLQVGGEYSIDAAQLADLTDRGIISAPADGLWHPADVVQAGAMLESRRQWAATPTAHDAKKHPCRIDLETYRVTDSLRELFAETPRLDLRHLLVLMAECDVREVREKLLCRIHAILEIDSGITL